MNGLLKRFNGAALAVRGPLDGLGQSRSPIKRTWLGSWLDGEEAVRKEVPLHDYLISRSLIYDKKAPQTLHPPTVIISVIGDSIVIEPNTKTNDHLLHRFLDDPAGVEEKANPEIAWIVASTHPEEQLIFKSKD